MLTKVVVRDEIEAEIEVLKDELQADIKMVQIRVQSDVRELTDRIKNLEIQVRKLRRVDRIEEHLNLPPVSSQP